MRARDGQDDGFDGESSRMTQGCSPSIAKRRQYKSSSRSVSGQVSQKKKGNAITTASPKFPA